MRLMDTVYNMLMPAAWETPRYTGGELRCRMKLRLTSLTLDLEMDSRAVNAMFTSTAVEACSE